MKEAYFATQLRQNVPEVQWTRIENVAGSGVPDVHVTHRGREMWVELKLLRGRQVEIRVSQINWLRAHLSNGATNVRYLVRDKDRILLLHPRIALGRAKRRTERSAFFSIEPDDVLTVWKMNEDRRGFDWTSIRDGLFAIKLSTEKAEGGMI